MTKVTKDNIQSFITDTEININTSDSPDFCDSYFESVELFIDNESRFATDDEIDMLSDDFLYESIEKELY